MTYSVKEYVKKLKKLKADVALVCYDTAKQATTAAVEAAQAKTPPPPGSKRGVNTVSGDLRDAWDTDSVVEPIIAGNGFQTIQGNNQDYASYVDQGHRMDRHFVPGLYVDPESGLLNYDLSAKVGLVVGTKTKYVPGAFMVDAAKEAYEKTCKQLLEKKIAELLK